MGTDALDRLLEQLSTGDDASAQAVFVAYEPYLRLVVRRMLPGRLRAKFDSIDVVQSVWADVLGGFRASDWQFASADHLKAFLVRATRNRFLDRVRQQRLALRHERSLDANGVEPSFASTQPDPGAVAQADELWQQMLALCPPNHQPLLELKRQGFSLADISARTGFHPSSIRRIFYDLARRLALTTNQKTAPDIALEASSPPLERIEEAY